MNQALLTGNLTRDPETRYTQGGIAICKFGLAVTEKRRGKDGKTTEETFFADITAFGKQGELIQQYCKKGSKLFVTCRLKTDTWDDKQTGAKKSKTALILEKMEFMGGGQGQGGGGQSKPPQPQARGQKAAEAPQDDALDDVPPMDGDDSVPF